ncbi:MAG TPA: helix-turn-helix transcriptional regulator [Gemmatimonadaceae bacterium]
MRRKPDLLLPLELNILEAALRLGRRGVTHFHGFALAKLLQENGDRRQLTAHGTLYRALHRLESAGLIEASWEDPQVAESENRPRRRMYCLLAAAEPAVKRARAEKRTASRLGVLRPDPEKA